MVLKCYRFVEENTERGTGRSRLALILRNPREVRFADILNDIYPNDRMPRSCTFRKEKPRDQSAPVHERERERERRLCEQSSMNKKRQGLLLYECQEPLGMGV